MIPEIVIILISILLSAFFSGMEIAFVSANKMHIELEKKKDNLLAHVLTRLTQRPSRFITTMLIGNNIALVVYGYFMGDLLVKLFLSPIENEFVVLLIQTFISTLIILVTAEFLPKAIFRVYANEALKLLAIPSYLFYVILYPISRLITLISDFFLRVFFNITEDEVQLAFSKAELGHYIDEQLESAEDEIDSEIQIFQNALEFHDVKAREAMIPRTEIVAVEVHSSVKTLRDLFTETGLSKIMVYDNSLDDIIGYAHFFDLFKKPKNIRSILLPIEIIPESMMIHDVLNDLIKKRKSVAVVLDEYGGTSGLITVEDIIEELFGEIEDEHDSVDLIEEKINDREYRFSTRLEVDYLNETYGLELTEHNYYETLGGLIVHHTESIPATGEVIEIDNYQFTILKESATKIEEVYLKVLFKDK